MYLHAFSPFICLFVYFFAQRFKNLRFDYARKFTFRRSGLFYLCICETGDLHGPYFLYLLQGERNEDRVVLLHALFTVQTAVHLGALDNTGHSHARSNWSSWSSR